MEYIQGNVRRRSCRQELASAGEKYINNNIFLYMYRGATALLVAVATPRCLAVAKLIIALSFEHPIEREKLRVLHS